jgi:hypothetical protein
MHPKLPKNKPLGSLSLATKALSFPTPLLDVGNVQLCGTLVEWPTPMRFRFSSETVDGWCFLLRSASG